MGTIEPILEASVWNQINSWGEGVVELKKKRSSKVIFAFSIETVACNHSLGLELVLCLTIFLCLAMGMFTKIGMKYKASCITPKLDKYESISK